MCLADVGSGVETGTVKEQSPQDPAAQKRVRYAGYAAAHPNQQNAQIMFSVLRLKQSLSDI